MPKGSVCGASPRIAGVAHNTCVSVVRAASQKAQRIRNGEVHAVDTEVINADELWSFVPKSKSTADPMS